MAGPWEKYAAQAPASGGGSGKPWEKYGRPPSSPDDYSPLETGILSTANGATMNLFPRAYGAISAVGDVVGGDSKLADFANRYDLNKKFAERQLENAETQNPKAALAGEVGGGLLSAAVPGLGALNAGKAGGVLSGLGKAALSGAVSSYGATKSDDTGENISNAISGAGLGAATHGVLKGIGTLAQPKELAKKLGSTFLNTPEELIENYIENPEAIKTAPLRHELASKFGTALDDLATNVKEGSQASRQILSDEGKTFSGMQVSNYFKDMADKLKAESEGVWDDPQIKGAYDKFTHLADEYGKNPKSFFTTNKIKGLVQSLDKQINYENQHGAIKTADQALLGKARGGIDELLKSTSPAYVDEMKDVAKNASLLSNTKEAIGDKPEQIANTLRRAISDKYGSGPMALEALKRFDAARGTDFAEQAKNSLMREAFDKSVTNGSRNVNLWDKVVSKIPALEEAPLVKTIGPIIGAATDVSGRKMTQSVIDGAIALNKLYKSSPTAQAFSQAAAPIMEAAKNGNKEAAAIMYLFRKQNEAQGGAE